MDNLKTRYTHQGKELDLCSGDRCIHRFRCYRHSLYQDAIFKNMSFKEIIAKGCIESEDDKPGYSKMWLPNVKGVYESKWIMSETKDLKRKQLIELKKNSISIDKTKLWL